MAANETLVQNIASWKDIGVFQNQSVMAVFGQRQGLIVAEWSVEGQMDIDGEDTALPIGTYYPTLADSREPVAGGGTANAKMNLTIPKGAILLQTPIMHVHKAKAGSGTLDAYIGSTKLSSDAALTSTGTYVDDGAGNIYVAGYLFTAAAEINFRASSNTLTAGSVTIFIPYVMSNAV